ncbi:MAG: hypothetical protein A3H98_04075 [Bacteroidetes bacterium RIFCSPLOWO2_02_FULL_36_8]|nr:MAG: hypothetical protein A3H98_04075 [Bacteroidetes bacterium RIFCSPLOWO2_02_FULL_36_8]OFY68810.1 MAG: hypothetical protein A3G23_03200 [Bacteroidetes bacterium RIFCSPLOWO2_12_FULL_37_12]
MKRWWKRYTKNKIMKKIFITGFCIASLFFLSSINSARKERSHSLDDIPFTLYNLDVSKCTGFQHHTGSKVFIPQEALLFKNNKPCNTKITFSYRELRTPSEIITADITMKYFEGKLRKDLVTSGMFEVYAICEKETLALKPGKTINVFFAVENVETKTIAYRYDFTNSVWNNYNSPVADLSATSMYSDSVNQLWGSSPVPSLNDSSQIRGEDGEEYDIESGRRWEYENALKNNAFKSLEIDSFGLYNYDYILDKENYVPIVADFKILNQKAPLTRMVYVVYPHINSVLYFSPYEWKTGFSILPVEGVKIFSIMDNGNVAMLPSTDLTEQSVKSWKMKSHTFLLVENITLVQNSRQLASVTGIDQIVKK